MKSNGDGASSSSLDGVAAGRDVESLAEGPEPHCVAVSDAGQSEIGVFGGYKCLKRISCTANFFLSRHRNMSLVTRFLRPKNARSSTAGQARLE